MKRQNGITLIALVISIIVMLILAGVSINAIVGENGVLTKAQNATIENKKAGILEAIDLELASYNIDTILSNPESTADMLNGLISKGVIDTVVSSSGQTTDGSKALGIPQFDSDNRYTGYIAYGVKKEDYSILLSVDNSGIYKASFGNVDISSGGNVAAGTTVVTKDAFNNSDSSTSAEEQGKFTIDKDASVIFVDEIGQDGKELSIYVKSGVNAKVNVFKNMTLTNAGLKRSAIDIESGGTLELYVADGATLNVVSGVGEEGEAKDTYGSKGGEGGYAGIHVPENASLTLKGNGTIIATGGNAGRGGSGGANGTNNNVGGGGGGGAGAGIGGNGGMGGYANLESYANLGYDASIKCSGSDGEAGENCGTIYIMNALTVYAYGGSAGGVDASTNVFSPSGAGGYPAAGIGGGGAGAGGGCHSSGAGGYTGSNGQARTTFGNENGLAGYESGDNGNGAGYFESTTRTSNYIVARMGGQGGINDKSTQNWIIDYSGDGGIAGKGGTIKVSQNAKIYAYNGNKYTDGTDYENGKNQLEIFCQNGQLREVYKYNSHWGEKIQNGNSHNYLSSGEAINSYSYLHSIMGNTIALTGEISKPSASNPLANILVRASKTCAKSGYQNSNSNSIYGVGSGAGYIELSNGTYKVDNSLN